VYKYYWEKAPEGHEDHESAPPFEALIDLEFGNAPEYIVQTYEAETIVDIFSRVSGYFTSVFYIMRFFIDPYIAWHMTKLIIENLYSQASYHGSGHHGPYGGDDNFGRKTSHHNGSSYSKNGSHERAGHHPPYRDDPYKHSGGGHDPPIALSKERLKVAGQLLKEKFDISKHMIHLYQMAK